MKTTCRSAPVGSWGRPQGPASLPVVAAERAVLLEAASQEFVAAEDQNRGHLEVEVLRPTQELQCRAVEAGARAKADATPPCGPVCRQRLSRLTHGHARTVRTRFGPVILRRPRGGCRHCKQWRFPADAVLGLEDRAAWNAWLEPLQWPLKNGSAVKVIRQLEELLGELEEGRPARETVAREVACLREPWPRRDYRRAARCQEPLGRGAVEAAGGQGPCRFQRTGQFWRPAGDEALLGLQTFWRNERRPLLSPHTCSPKLSKDRNAPPLPSTTAKLSHVDTRYQELIRCKRLTRSMVEYLGEAAPGLLSPME